MTGSYDLSSKVFFIATSTRLNADILIQAKLILKPQEFLQALLEQQTRC